jgi:VWFA-related protein
VARPLRDLVGTALVLLALAGIVGDHAEAALDASREGGQQSAQPAAQPQQQPATDAQQPVFRSGIDYVRVDVIITDRNGNPVADLQPTDFEVNEDGKPQTIDTFKLIKLDGGVLPTPDGPPRAIRNDNDEEVEAARDDVRLFAIFLDDYHVRKLASMSVRNPLSTFIDTQLGPSDMLGVMHPLDSIYSIRMTRDRQSVARAVQQFEGRRFEYTPRNPAEERYAHLPTLTVERIRNQVSLSAMKALIVHMGSLKEGRKALVLVTEGYSNMLPPQLRNSDAQLPGFDNPDRNNPFAGLNNPTEDSSSFFASEDMQGDLRDVYDLANRNNVAIYVVDPRGLTTSEFDIDQNIAGQIDAQYLRTTMDTMRTLADQTDGRAILNRNDLLVGMKQIVRDTSAYYLIGYNSTQAPRDGKFHDIRVRVKRAGLDVRARKGYWAFSANDVARALMPAKAGPSKAVEEALSTVNDAPRSRIIRTWIGTSRGENGKTKITFVWEPAPDPAGTRDNNARREAPSRVALTAVGPDGAPYFRGRVPSAASASGVTAGTKGAVGLPSQVTFEAIPGKMELRVAVEDASSQVLDSETREITVPDLTGVQTLLGTPEVLRARNAREAQQLKADAAAMPLATREFSRTDRLLIRVPAYGPGNTVPTLSVHLLNRSGQPMTEVQATASGALGVQQIDLPLANLPPGDYILEIKIAGNSAEVKQLVGFRVTG